MTKYFRPGHLYRHSNNRDVAFEVISSYYVKPQRTWSLKVSWWNIGACHSPWPMGESQRIKIPHENSKDWKIMRYDERLPAPKLRTL